MPRNTYQFTTRHHWKHTFIDLNNKPFDRTNTDGAAVDMQWLTRSRPIDESTITKDAPVEKPVAQN